MRLHLAQGARDRLETLHPGYFAMVMATGIVSIALDLQGFSLLSMSLLGLNLLIYPVLLILFTIRFGRYRDAFLADMANSQRGVGFFTWVAAPGVLGAQVLLLAHAAGVALILWFIAVIAWIVTAYGVFAAIILRDGKPGMAQALNGGWLVSAVATQSVAILTVLLAQAGIWGGFTEAAMFASLAMWLGGGMQYILVIAMLFQRLTVLPVSAQDLAPPYWINMGAVAISTLAGVTLVRAGALSPLIAELTEFITGLTLLYWSIGTGWIPMLVVLGVWRFVVHGSPLSYEPLIWSMVFPLGMYSVCTYRLADLLSVNLLAPVAIIFAALALVAWAGALVGLIFSLRSAQTTTN